MKGDKELFKLAKHYVMLVDEYEKTMLDYELEELKEEMDKIRNAVLEKGYNIDKFVEYQNLYKEMSMAEYFEFIKTL